LLNAGITIDKMFSPSRHKVAQNCCRWQNSISNYGIRQFKNYLSRDNIMNPQTNNYAISKSIRDFDDAADKNKVIPGFPRLYIRIDGEAIASTDITDSEIAY
jgi:hypothetical protein